MELRLEAEMTAERYLRLRHELIPYLYSMNYRTHKFGRALCEPLYYDNPECEGAYKCRNGYMFGSELLVCPVTSKINKKDAPRRNSCMAAGGTLD